MIFDEENKEQLPVSLCVISNVIITLNYPVVVSHTFELLVLWQTKTNRIVVACSVLKIAKDSHVLNTWLSLTLVFQVLVFLVREHSFVDWR